MMVRSGELLLSGWSLFTETFPASVNDMIVLGFVAVGDGSWLSLH